MSRTGPKGRRSGFTLIEILVVLFALVILAAAVIPSLRGAGQGEDLDNVTAQVIACARYARQVAASRGVSVDLTVDGSAEMIRLFVEQDSGANGPQTSITASRRSDGGGAAAYLPAKYAQVSLPTGITAHLEPAPEDPANPTPATGSTPSPLAVNSEALRFPADGPCPGGLIILNDPRGRERRILVQPRTAEVGLEANG